MAPGLRAVAITLSPEESAASVISRPKPEEQPVISQTLEEAQFSPGVLAKADGGVLYVDEVNLLADHLVDVLLDVAASGTNVVERDGISHRHAARFVLIGTMNPEEGELRPQLLDRFGLNVVMSGQPPPAERGEIIRRRLDFDADPQGFCAHWPRSRTPCANAASRPVNRCTASPHWPWPDRGEALLDCGGDCGGSGAGAWPLDSRRRWRKANSDTASISSRLIAVAPRHAAWARAARNHTRSARMPSTAAAKQRSVMYVRPLRTTNGRSCWAARSALEGGSLESMVRLLTVVAPERLDMLSAREAAFPAALELAPASASMGA